MWISWGICWTSLKATACSSDFEGYIPPADDDERLFVRRLGILCRPCASAGCPATPFLSDRQQELARAALAGLGFEGYAFDGGYPDAERRILRLFGEYGAQEPLPAVCLFAQTLRADKSTHSPGLSGRLREWGEGGESGSALCCRKTDISVRSGYGRAAGVRRAFQRGALSVCGARAGRRSCPAGKSARHRRRRCPR